MTTKRSSQDPSQDVHKAECALLLHTHFSRGCSNPALARIIIRSTPPGQLIPPTVQWWSDVTATWFTASPKIALDPIPTLHSKLNLNPQLHNLKNCTVLFAWDLTTFCRNHPTLWAGYPLQITHSEDRQHLHICLAFQRRSRDTISNVCKCQYVGLWASWCSCRLRLGGPEIGCKAGHYHK